jgi:hypothetical protein
VRRVLDLLAAAQLHRTEVLGRGLRVHERALVRHPAEAGVGEPVDHAELAGGALPTLTGELVAQRGHPRHEELRGRLEVVGDQRGAVRAGAGQRPVLADVRGQLLVQRVELALHGREHVRADRLRDGLDASRDGLGLRGRVLDDADARGEPTATSGGLLVLGREGALVLLEPLCDLHRVRGVREHLGRLRDCVSHDDLLQLVAAARSSAAICR